MSDQGTKAGISSSFLLEGDALARLSEMDAGAVNCCITSPPYFGLRDYGQEGQIGLEATPDEYVARLVGVFAEVKRVLRDDGTLWLNLGDSYAGGGNGSRDPERWPKQSRSNNGDRIKYAKKGTGLKDKNLLGIPWMVAFALRADGWYLRSEIIWAKPNPMPESVTDRPTKAHEQVFLLSKSRSYYYDSEAIREPDLGTDHPRTVHLEASLEPSNGLVGPHAGIRTAEGRNGAGRNKRSVWTVATQPYPDAHFATFPPKLIEPMVLAGCPRGGTVLDPFAGSGTTLQVAEANGRRGIGIELNPDYIALAERRLTGVTPSMFDAHASSLGVPR
ncbi:MAG TPA: site-specific DNA-methyltransferase [Terriglobia bacterium]|nr:site-specific DNA-methyltransferase [Terriglobia bacterium]